MVRGIVIPADPQEPVFERQLNGLEDFQLAVSGYIEPIALETASITIWVDEEGKLNHRAPNPRATFFWWFVDSGMGREDLIVGDAVISVDGGDPQAEALLDHLVSQRHFRLEVTHVSHPDVWIAIHLEFVDWFDAARAALRLQSELAPLSSVRILPA